MYFWRIKELKQQMRDEAVPPGDVLGYVLGFVVIRWLPQLTLKLLPIPATTDSKVAVWPPFVLIGLLMCCLWVAYRANGGPTGQDLAGRLLALHWVVGLRFMLGFFVLTFMLIPVTLVLGMSPGGLESMKSQLVFLAVMAGFQLLYYWRIVHHLRDINVAPGAEP